jgi:alanine racemase
MAKNPLSRSYTNTQIKKFSIWRNAFLKAGYTPICHTSATSGTLLYKEAQYDMVRIGIGLYGIWPSEEARKFLGNLPEKILTDGKSGIFRALDEQSNASVKTLAGKIKLEPVLSWKTIVAEVKKVSKGEKIGYDGTSTLKRNSTIAVLPIGYWHGFPRALSNIGYVLINGKKAKIVGRVCMDIVMVDVTNIKNIKVGDEVVIIGKSGKIKITADDISKILNGSTYELLTRINPLIKRIYI